MSDGTLQLFLRSASESSGSGEGHGLGANHTHGDGAHGNHGRGTVLFLFTAFAVGGQQATPTNRRCTYIRSLYLYQLKTPPYSSGEACAKAHTHPLHCYSDRTWAGIWSCFKCGSTEHPL